MGCETANYLFTRCPEVVSTNCITYQGESIDCLGICKGMTLTKLEDIVVNKICDLATLTNMSVIDLTENGTCKWISDAWAAAHPFPNGEVDKTILNILSFILDELCVLNTKVDGLDKPLTVEFPLNYSCCGIPCGGETVFNMPTHLQNIINCICEVKSEITDLKNTINTLKNEILVLEDQINNPLNGIGALKKQLATQQIDISTLQSTVACIISAFSSQVGTITCP